MAPFLAPDHGGKVEGCACSLQVNDDWLLGHGMPRDHCRHQFHMTRSLGASNRGRDGRARCGLVNWGYKMRRGRGRVPNHSTFPPLLLLNTSHPPGQDWDFTFPSLPNSAPYS